MASLFERELHESMYGSSYNDMLADRAERLERISDVLARLADDSISLNDAVYEVYTAYPWAQGMIDAWECNYTTA